MSALDPLTTTAATTEETGAAAPSAPRVRRPGVLRRTLAARQAQVGLGVLVVVVLWAYLGPLFYPWTAQQSDVTAFGQPPSAQHWFGTNSIGQDIYAQTLAGLQKSLLIGFIAGPAASILAGIVGAVAGYLGGAWDRVLVWVIDLLLVIPSFFVLILLSPLFKQLSWVAMVAAIAAFGWMVMARVIRGQTMSLRERDFVKAARFMGVPTTTIIRRHILPNVASLLIIDATLGVGAAILTETTLSYFGFGVQAPQVSLGTLLAAGSSAAVTRPWLFVFPAGVLIITVLATSLLGDALRDAIDPTSGADRA
ncbi:peptide/nickel transport system permease protein [Quadrisphaera granulorum]|uniref:Oligopeptide transport system permease protein OppC n=1 Tax=Quadrisphaera granulorum TaxID=317664 RepID=A0A315ZRH3_9ACTN|nr:ABC transporter permease [Quadrisphaera granulorum]PWJ48135.1 peptide/nickel transport system permease protein [Quadrisphaera granulorum]SZE98504.1 peptide/nickel transport system permease protein [Quadrisphaera granulorum]